MLEPHVLAWRAYLYGAVLASRSSSERAGWDSEDLRSEASHGTAMSPCLRGAIGLCGLLLQTPKAAGKLFISAPVPAREGAFERLAPAIGRASGKPLSLKGRLQG